MDWELAIERNREALLRLLAIAVAAAGLVAGGAAQLLARRLRIELLRVLRPAEAAARRLIWLVARGIALPTRSARDCPDFIPTGNGTGARLPAFALLDPLRRPGCSAPPRVAGYGPRIGLIGFGLPAISKNPAPSDTDQMDAARLCRRVAALQRALESLPAQAKRLLRWQARRARSAKPGRVSPLRTGRPPGYKERARHGVDVLLRECDDLARMARASPEIESFATKLKRKTRHSPT